MGPKRGGRQARGTRYEPRRDQKKTWEEGADNLEASLSRLKVENKQESSSEVDEEGSCSTGEASSDDEKVQVTWPGIELGLRQNFNFFKITQARVAPLVTRWLAVLEIRVQTLPGAN